MGLHARIVPRSGRLPKVSYRWDAETDILTGAVKGGAREPDGDGLTGSVELEGADGSFILLDVQGGAIRGVEVVVWPDVRTVPALAAPAGGEGDVVLPQSRPDPALAALEVDTALTIETNAAESLFRVRVGASRRVEVVHVADGLLVEVDEHHDVAGLWLTGVPPFPADEPAP